MSRDCERAVDCVYGDWQRPINHWQGANNSIHTDAVARKVGLRGGTVPGSSHLGHFRPILTDLFGERWYRSSCISMFYTYATVDRELPALIARDRPDAIVMFGLAARSQALRIETRAVNALARRLPHSFSFVRVLVKTIQS